mmetsp:Transcript_30699/g.68990  ORF Transcript_30699/g.68990 Transcript_30699/m.68990 type:complete len:222 (+) Transcript_30699:64-729(+)
MVMRPWKLHWHLWLLSSLRQARADGPTTTTTEAQDISTGSLSMTTLCEDCTCPFNSGQKGFMTIEACFAACEFTGSMIQHSSRTSSDGDNCACCTAPTMATVLLGVNVYKRELPLTTNVYFQMCESCWCNAEGWLGASSIADCATACAAFPGFQHANGVKRDGGQGDYNCACCGDPSQNTPDDTWGVNVYDTEAKDVADQASSSSSCATLVAALALLLLLV